MGLKDLDLGGEDLSGGILVPVKNLILWLCLKEALVGTKFSVILEHYSKCTDWFDSPSSGEEDSGIQNIFLFCSRVTH